MAVELSADAPDRCVSDDRQARRSLTVDKDRVVLRTTYNRGPE